jgi:hypothetical protein
MRLKLKHGKQLSSFDFKLKLRRYSMEGRFSRWSSGKCSYRYIRCHRQQLRRRRRRRRRAPANCERVQRS